MSEHTPESIGPYTIDRELGRGGMGVVYLGTDTRLDRKVAIKALPEHLAQDQERLGRFEREAKTMAALNHPNVAGIHGVEEQDGNKYLVLEFVDGENLADRLDRGPLDLTEALDLAVQIAAGVEAAHDAGVVHRDLKPANVIITPDGKAKVLDFGLARVDDGSSSTSGELTSAQTMNAAQNSPTVPGVILGTAAYMSPEQARGRRVDKRTDIWSFGVLLYEMLSGSGPFQGETATDSIGAVLHKEPSFDRLPSSTPPMVRHVLRRCLTKDKNKRYRDIGDVRLELESMGSIEAGPATAAAGPLARVWPVAAMAALALSIAGWALYLRGGSADQNTKAYSLSIPLGPELQVTGHMEISPDGRTLVFAGMKPSGDTQLYRRHLDSFDIEPISRTRDGMNPGFSPDGQDIVYYANGEVYRMPTAGGNPIRLCSAGWMAGAAWLPDDRIVFAAGVGSPLMVVPAGGGAPEPFTNLENDPADAYAHVWPQHIKGTNQLLFTAWCGGPGGGARIMDMESGEIRALGEADGFFPPMRWVASGHLVVERFNQGLLCLAYDPNSTAPVPLGEARQLLENTYFLGNSTHSVFSVSENGVGAYAGGYEDLRRLVWADENGNTELVLEQSQIEDYARMGSDLDLSPDGRRAIVSGSGEVVEVDLVRKIARPVTSTRGTKQNGIYGHDGTYVIYSSNAETRWSIWRSGLNAGGQEEMLLQRDENIGPTSVSPSGAVLYETRPADGSLDLWILEPDGTQRALLTADYDEYDGKFSPDGKWVVYGSDQTGRNEVYVTSADGKGKPVQVSINEGDSPKWTSSGGGVFYRRGRLVMRIDIRDGEPVGEPQVVYPARNIITGSSYEVTADGTRMLAVELDEAAIPREIYVISDFFAFIRSKLGE